MRSELAMAGGAAEEVGDRLLAKLPQPVADSLTSEQAAAIRAAAAADRAWGPNHPANVRFTIPLPFWPLFLSVVTGRERRSPSRRMAERRVHPIRTAANIAFFTIVATVLFLSAAVGVLVYSSVLEF
ncbi:MAG: hypothetical protein V3U18_04430 [Alphaproteobacteria bacterium]